MYTPQNGGRSSCHPTIACAPHSPAPSPPGARTSHSVEARLRQESSPHSGAHEDGCVLCIEKICVCRWSAGGQGQSVLILYPIPIKIQGEIECRRPGPECIDFPLNSNRNQRRNRMQKARPECIDLPLNSNRNQRRNRVQKARARVH